MKPILLLALPHTDVSSQTLAQIEALAPHMRVAQEHERSKIEEMLDEIEIAVGAFPYDLTHQAGNLRWLQQWGAGADWLMRYPEAAQKDFIVTNASGVHAVPISEHIFAMLLAYARHLPDAVRAQEDRVWIGNHWQKVHGTSIDSDQRYVASFRKEDMIELAGKTMLIAGVGEIGARTACIAQAFGMKVIGVRRNTEENVPGVDRLVGPDELTTVLPEADVVVNTLPMTVATRHLFGAEAFAAMPSTAAYISIGRGGTTDEAALAEALQRGAIAWAGLDVFETEPLPKESPLWDLPNLLVTSHYSGLTPQYDNRAMAIFLDNLARYVKGEPMRNVVDKRLGY